jgi:protein SCO1
VIVTLSAALFMTRAWHLATPVRGERPRAAASSSAAASSTTSPANAIPRVPPFRFVDPNGRPVTPADLAGHVWIFDFIYTTCTSFCPTLTAKFALLERELTSEDLRFVSFSVDPEHDTEAALAGYAERFRPDERRWLLLRTEPEQLAAFTRAVGVSVGATGDPTNPIRHSTAFFLVDRDGTLHRSYDSSDPSALARLAADAASLSGGSVHEPADDTGARLVRSLGCNGCHENPALAPTLAGLWGKRVPLADGREVEVDAAYLREALVEPSAKIVRGYLDLMPAYGSALSAASLDALVLYLRALPEVAGLPTLAPSKNAPVLVVDPVCGMAVRVAPTTPSAEHAGRRYFFCSETCRKAFEKNPQRYAASQKTDPEKPRSD